MAGKPTEIISVNRNATVKAAAINMQTHKIGCLVVNDDNGRFIGLITERDIANQVACSCKDPGTTTVAEVMTAQIVSCSPGTPTSKAREIMATNRIRHLPIVDNETVVGILSVRDLMGQQLLEDRTAAQEVAMLSNCLKSIDLNEVANIVTREVPKLFQADRCVLCFHSDDSTRMSSSALPAAPLCGGESHPSRGKRRGRNSLPKGSPKSDNQGPVLVSCNNCLCLKEKLMRLEEMGTSADKDGFCYDSVPDSCVDRGVQSPRLVIPLKVCGLRDVAPGGSKQLLGYLCMCGLAATSAGNRELTSYKAKLAREILNSHLTNAKLYQDARLTSLTDTLTGVGSRKLLEDKLEAECIRAQRYNHCFAVAITDLDNFKTINDLLGHATGDSALKQLADCMRDQKRAPDVIARYGGDEFVVLMPETEAEDALVLLERLRSEVHRIKLGENMLMSISCGVAQSTPDRKDSASEVMRRADLALYEAKNGGRNCVKVWNKDMSKLLSAGDIEIEKIKRLQRRITGLSEKAEKMFMASIWGLVQALEAKDAYAKKHSENVTYYAVGIAETMNVGPRQTEVIRRAAMIHDIGKIGVPDAIISKPENLTARERKIIEEHPIIAVRILSKMSFLEREVAIVRHHHEKWNGQGYPDGLSGTSIPMGARIMAVADAFDALTSSRSYRDSRSVIEVMKILADSSGYEFDAEAVKGLLSWVEKVAGELNRPLEKLTVEELLQSRKQFDQTAEELFVNDPALSNSTT